MNLHFVMSVTYKAISNPTKIKSELKIEKRDVLGTCLAYIFNEGEAKMSIRLKKITERVAECFLYGNLRIGETTWRVFFT